MTTAPTPAEAERIASLLKAYATTTDSDLLLLGETLLEAAELLTRLQVENERLRAELEERKPLPLSDEQLRAEFTPWAEIQYRHEDEFSKRDFKICLAAWSAGRRITGGSS